MKGWRATSFMNDVAGWTGLLLPRLAAPPQPAALAFFLTGSALGSASSLFADTIKNTRILLV